MSACPNPFRQALDRGAASGFAVRHGPRDCLIIAAPSGHERLILLSPRVAKHNPLVLANTIARFTAAARWSEARHTPQSA